MRGNRGNREFRGRGDNRGIYYRTGGEVIDYPEGQGIELQAKVDAQILTRTFEDFCQQLSNPFIKWSDSFDNLRSRFQKDYYGKKLDNITVIREYLLEGVIPLKGWQARLDSIDELHSSTLSNITAAQRELSIKNTKLTDLLRQVEKCKKEIEATENNLSSLESEKESLEFFSRLLGPISKEETSLVSSFKSKLGKIETMGKDDISLFLGLAGLSSLVQQFELQNMTVEEILAAFSVADYESFGIKDELQEKKFIFNFKLLQHKLFLEPEKMRGCLVGRYLGVEKTAEILKEYEMPISKEKIVERSISLGPLVYFDAKNVRNVFGLAFNPSIAVTKQLHSWRLDFECFLASQLAQELHILP